MKDQPKPLADADVRYSVAATIDLLGFSAHLETGGNDLRTTIGREAVTRLDTLERALAFMSRELTSCSFACPKDVHYQRINDALILSLDLSSFLTPAVGETSKDGFSAYELMQEFDMDLYDGPDGEGRFAADVAGRVRAETEDLIKFVGVVARLHLFINAEERKRVFPGAKTICVTGFRRRFNRSDGTEDPLAANFAYANAFLADRALHGPCFFLDDNVARLLCVNAFAQNLVRYACYVTRPKVFDPTQEHSEELHRDVELALSTPISVALFRKTFVFRELSADPLSYLQILQRLSEYLTGSKQPAQSVLTFILELIRKGPELEAMRGGKPPQRRLPPNDISSDVRVVPELIESGSSATMESYRETQVMNDLVTSARPDLGPDAV
jgi:hypothetical protein